MDRLELRTKFAGKVEKLPLPEFDTEVFVRSLSALDRARVLDKFKVLNKEMEADGALVRMTTEAQCFIVARGLVDQSGNRTYSDEEVAAIGEEIPSKALDAISRKILSLSGIGETAEDPLKNSDPTPNAALTSVLQ